MGACEGPVLGLRAGRRDCVRPAEAQVKSFVESPACAKADGRLTVKKEMWLECDCPRGTVGGNKITKTGNTSLVIKSLNFILNIIWHYLVYIVISRSAKAFQETLS